MSQAVKDSRKSHWVNRSPSALRPYLQLSRLDRPVGYWLLTLPGWIGLAFAGFSQNYSGEDIKLALLILIGAIAMRGAGCTYNDIVDQDLDAQVERTALRPLPAGTVTTRQAWIWLFAQCAVGLIVLLCLPRLAQIISLCSIPLVAAYPFMKRITWWPQLWLGMTFNWAVLVAYAAKTGEVSAPVLILYAGLIFWTIGYDTIYACQDIEDDGLVGIKSTARRFGRYVRPAVALCYLICLCLILYACTMSLMGEMMWRALFLPLIFLLVLISFFALHLIWQIWAFRPDDAAKALAIFKSNFWAGIILTLSLTAYSFIWG